MDDVVWPPNSKLGCRAWTRVLICRVFAHAQAHTHAHAHALDRTPFHSRAENIKLQESSLWLNRVTPHKAGTQLHQIAILFGPQFQRRDPLPTTCNCSQGAVVVAVQPTKMSLLHTSQGNTQPSQPGLPAPSTGDIKGVGAVPTYCIPFSH